MRKNILIAISVIGFIFAVFSLNNVFSASQVQVTAVVNGTGSTNATPLIISTSPSQTPVAIQRNKIQEFAIYIKDVEGEDIIYTISPQVGSVSITSGTLTNTAGGVYLNFTYLAPSTKPSPNSKKITISFNDTTPGNTVIKEFPLYIY